MNTKIKFIVLFLAFGALVFNSCKKDKEAVPAPKVTITELGHGNSKKVAVGSDLHVEADILAEGKIKIITVEIHKEEEGHKSASDHDNKLNLTVTYNEFQGQKNAKFHKHVDIPANAEVGHYHFHFKVVDMEGQETIKEEELEIIKQP